MKFQLFVLAAALSVASSQPNPTNDFRFNTSLPMSVSNLKLDTSIQVKAPNEFLDKLSGSTTDDGDAIVIIRLSNDSVAGAHGKGLATAPGQVKREAQVQQESFLEDVLAADPDASVYAKVQVVLNAVFVNVKKSALKGLAGNPNVVNINPVGNYELDLSETVPYIGATAVQNAGVTGKGVSVAVLDSGIDYTHENLGGSGDSGDYDAAYADPASRDGLFPTDKVVEGYDFVGADWPGDLLQPDEDPIDGGPANGHGTHVADIIAGKNGVAPDALLYAVKVCSSVASSCSGVALIQGMEYAVDPDGDGDPSDHVDIINMSLGGLYGQPFDDDLSAAVDNASALGVLTVASAGNSGDKPYANGTPASAKTALSVAQTQVPSASLQLLSYAEYLIPAVFQLWSVPLTSTINDPVQYGDGAGGNLNGCTPFPPSSLEGKVVLVDRGDCDFTEKISNISQGGGLAGIIGLVAPGAPFSGGDGGHRPIDIPGFMISQSDSTFIKENLDESINIIIDPSNQLPLLGQMVGSSSRGPQHDSTQLVKPEIGAPGASVSAIAGSGNGEGPFGGTSGAAPMVAGAAALLLEAFPLLTPLEVKAMLMNNGETEIMTDPFTGLAPITRIGGGEVRVDQALDAPAIAWDDNGFQGALSFGFHDVTDETLVLHKTVRIRSYSDRKIKYTIVASFRFQDDEDNGAVSITTPGQITVRPNKDSTFEVKLKINGALLRGNYMNSGSMGANPDGLTLNEYDGYIVLDDGNHPIHIPWHVLPRKAANVIGRSLLNFKSTNSFPLPIDSIQLTNNGVGTAQIDAYSLLAKSENVPEGGNGEQNPTPDIRAVGINTFPVPPGYCSDDDPSFVWAFAISTWERQEHLVPVSHWIYLDIDQDGVDDFAVLNRDFSVNDVSDGRQLAWAYNLLTGSLSAFFFAEHSMNTGNTVLLICGEQVGLTGTDMLSTNVNVTVYTQDFYNGGPGDLVEGLVVTPLGEQYYGIPEDIAGKNGGDIAAIDFGLFPGNTPELGLLVLTNGDRGDGNRGGASKETETFIISKNPPPDKSNAN